MAIYIVSAWWDESNTLLKFKLKYCVLESRYRRRRTRWAFGMARIGSIVPCSSNWNWISYGGRLDDRIKGLAVQIDVEGPSKIYLETNFRVAHFDYNLCWAKDLQWVKKASRFPAVSEIVLVRSDMESLCNWRNRILYFESYVWKSNCAIFYQKQNFV